MQTGAEAVTETHVQDIVSVRKLLKLPSNPAQCHHAPGLLMPVVRSLAAFTACARQPACLLLFALGSHFPCQPAN